MKIKVQEATNTQLDWLVAKCLGERYSSTTTNNGIGMKFPATNYSTDWTQGGPIIERERIDIAYLSASDLWCAVADTTENKYTHFGPTPLIAAMRCYVASKLGDEVEMTSELA